jgi:hypothetical protein
MERFRLRIRHAPKRGDVWELKLFPDRPDHLTREADGRDLGSCSNPQAIYWLRQVAAPFLSRAFEPGPVAGDGFSAPSDPCWLQPEDGMRPALAFSAAKYLVAGEQRARFQEGLAELPSEVILYWFTLCFYGYRQAAGKAALRTLLTHEEPEVRRKASSPAPRSKREIRRPAELFERRTEEVRERLAEYVSGKIEERRPGTVGPAGNRASRSGPAAAHKARRVRRGAQEKP